MLESLGLVLCTYIERAKNVRIFGIGTLHIYLSAPKTEIPIQPLRRIHEIPSQAYHRLQIMNKLM